MNSPRTNFYFLKMLKASRKVPPYRHLHRQCATILRAYSTDSKVIKKPQQYDYKKPAPPPETWLARYLRRSPRAMATFKSAARVLGMGNPRQVAGQITFHYYQDACSSRELEERAFWQEGAFSFVCSRR